MENKSSTISFTLDLPPAIFPVSNLKKGSNKRKPSVTSRKLRPSILSIMRFPILLKSDTLPIEQIPLRMVNIIINPINVFRAFINVFEIGLNA